MGNKVAFAWFFDRILKTVAVYRLEPGMWIGGGALANYAKVHADRLPELELNLDMLRFE